jgi:hypothetical protein
MLGRRCARLDSCDSLLWRVIANADRQLWRELSHNVGAIEERGDRNDLCFANREVAVEICRTLSRRACCVTVFQPSP